MKTQKTTAKRSPSKRVRPVQSRAAITKSKKTKKRALRNSYPVHKRVLLHPATLFGLLCAGVFIGGWTYRVVADTIISSVIEAPALQQGALITSHVNGLIFATPLIRVAGTCPVNSYVKLNVNGAFGGAALCNTGTFTVNTSLYGGLNTLVAQDYNETDVQGPATPAIKVVYQEPTQTSTTTMTTTTSKDSPNGANSPTPISPPLLLTSDFKFQTFTSLKTFTWKFDLEGGTVPYNVHISWGDGMTSQMHFDTDPIVTLKHVFKTFGYYPVVVSSTDAAGQVKVMQLAALITTPTGQANFLNTSKLASNQTPSNSRLEATKKWLLVAWPSYLIVLLMAASFWLGERRVSAFVKARK